MQDSHPLCQKLIICGDWLVRTIQLHLAAQHESPSRMAGRGTRRGPPQVTSLGGCRRITAYGVRSVRHGYMLTTPAAGRGWQRDGAGGAPGAAAPARSGAGGADALVENQAQTRLHVTHH